MFPQLATPEVCDKTHVYQTFIAGRLTYELRRQSQLDTDAHIRRVCTKEIANWMSRSRDRRSDWEIRVLGPQRRTSTTSAASSVAENVRSRSLSRLLADYCRLFNAGEQPVQHALKVPAGRIVEAACLPDGGHGQVAVQSK